MAVASWRFVNFNIDKPDSPDSAKQSYVVMYHRIQVIERTNLSSICDSMYNRSQAQ